MEIRLFILLQLKGRVEKIECELGKIEIFEVIITRINPHYQSNNREVDRLTVFQEKKIEFMLVQ